MTHGVDRSGRSSQQARRAFSRVGERLCVRRFAGDYGRARSRVRAMVRLEALPRWARETVVRFLPPVDALRALPFVSEGTLRALNELSLPIGRLNGCTLEEAVRQAHARRRAWDLHTLDLSRSGTTDVSALAGCAALHTLKLKRCNGVTDASALAGCAALHILDISYTQVTDVSALAGCAMLHTLNLGHCRSLTDWQIARPCSRSTSIAAQD